MVKAVLHVAFAAEIPIYTCEVIGLDGQAFIRKRHMPDRARVTDQAARIDVKDPIAPLGVEIPDILHMRVPRKHEVHACVGEHGCDLHMVADEVVGAEEAIKRVRRQQRMVPHREQHVAALLSKLQLLAKPLQLILVIPVKAALPADAVVVEREKPITGCDLRDIGEALLVHGKRRGGTELPIHL